MACRRHLAILFSVCLLAQALAAPADMARRRRGFGNIELDAVSIDDIALKSSDSDLPSTSAPTSTSAVTLDPFGDDDDDEVFSDPMQPAPTTGSSIFSLLRLAGALFPSSGGATQETKPASTTQAPSSPLWTFKMDILRAFLQLGTSVLGAASASSTNAITV